MKYLNKPRCVCSASEEKVNKVMIMGVVFIFTYAGCTTSADMSYKYQDNEAECTQLGRDIAQQTGDSKYKRSLSLRYHRDCVGK